MTPLLLFILQLVGVILASFLALSLMLLIAFSFIIYYKREIKEVSNLEDIDRIHGRIDNMSNCIADIKMDVKALNAKVNNEPN